VEDNPGDVGLVRHVLAEHGITCELLVLRDGEKALEFVEQVDESRIRCPQLVILDLNLPKTNGREVLRRMKISPVCGNVPVVILSSSDALKDRQDTAALGASRYIRKPPTLDEFLKIGGVLKMLLDNAA
jgi:chemotaxis family two-component system response regulator Rcp1